MRTIILPRNNPNQIPEFDIQFGEYDIGSKYPVRKDLFICILYPTMFSWIIKDLIKLKNIHPYTGLSITFYEVAINEEDEILEWRKKTIPLHDVHKYFIDNLKKNGIDPQDIVNKLDLAIEFGYFKKATFANDEIITLINKEETAEKRWKDCVIYLQDLSNELNSVLFLYKCSISLLQYLSDIYNNLIELISRK